MPTSRCCGWGRLCSTHAHSIAGCSSEAAKLHALRSCEDDFLTVATLAQMWVV